MSEKRKIIVSVLLTFVLTFSICTYANLRGNDYRAQDELHYLIEKEFVSEADKALMNEGACRGMVMSLGDRHSYYMSNEEYKSLMENVTGNYRGIGVEVYVNGDKLTVINVFSGTPAYNAGLMTGDIILGVDSFTFVPEKYEEFIRYLRGISEEGAAVEEMTLNVERQGNAMVVKINRDDISQQTVYKSIINGVLYIRLTDFTQTTLEEFKNAIKGHEGYRGVVLDVRSNPGGLLNSVVEISDMLLPESIITYTKNKAGNIQKYRSDKDFIDIPLVVLINKDSASASEILAASLHDNKKAYLIGEKTYGKGSVQEIFKLSDGSAAKLTVAHYYTPADICIDGIGIQPDLEVTLPEEAKTVPLHMLDYKLDNQLSEAIAYLSR